MNVKEFDAMMGKIARLKHDLACLSRLKLPARDRRNVERLKKELCEVEQEAKTMREITKAMFQT